MTSGMMVNPIVRTIDTTVLRKRITGVYLL
jgi:hypothetical protein